PKRGARLGRGGLRVSPAAGGDQHEGDGDPRWYLPHSQQSIDQRPPAGRRNREEGESSFGFTRSDELPTIGLLNWVRSTPGDHWRNYPRRSENTRSSTRSASADSARSTEVAIPSSNERSRLKPANSMTRRSRAASSGRRSWPAIFT